MEELDFEKLFNVQIVAMKLRQCHPDTKLDKYWILNNLITLGPYTLYFLLLSNCMKHYALMGDYFNTFNNAVPVTYYVCVMFYVCMVIINRSTLGNLIKYMKMDYAKARDMDIIRQNVLIKYAMKGKRFMQFWFVLMVLSLFSFILKSIFLSFYYTNRNGEMTLIPFHEMYYPLNITEYRPHNVYLFAITYLGECYFTAMTLVIYTVVVPLGPIIILHACAKMELIKIKFENVFQSDDVDAKLKEIAENLQSVYGFVKEINICFTLIYEIMLKQTILLIPFTTYAIIQSIKYGEFTVEYLCIVPQAFISSGTPCYYGDLLMQKGEEVRQAAYNCGWERVYIPSARKTLLIILTRAMKPVAIQTIFSTICLDTLTNVYRQAYTIFNLMTAMW